jgi:hypothetical protein
MRYLRMLTNSIVAGALGAAYVTVLVLQLNPQVPLLAPGLWRWFVTLLAFYGVHLSVLFYALIVVRELLGAAPLSPGWLSVRILAWLSALTAAGAALLMWVNVRGFEIELEADAARRLRLGAAATTMAAVILVAIVIVRYSFGRRGSQVSAALLAITVAGSLSLPMAARGFGSSPPLGSRQLSIPVDAGQTPAEGPRVTLILLDGASLDFLWARVSEGRFPSFGRILDAGAVVDVATLRPTQAEPVWAAVATGKHPPKNGVRSAARYRVRPGQSEIDLLPDSCYAFGLLQFGLVQSVAQTSAAWRARPLWDILGRYGMGTGVVRWPVTFPVQPGRPVRGFIVTDRFHTVADSPIPSEVDQAIAPPDIVPAARQAYADASTRAARGIVPPGAPGALLAEETPAESAERLDRIYGRVADEARRIVDVRLLALRYQGLDTVGHSYLRYAEPRRFGDVSETERRQYGDVLNRYYAFIDGELERAIVALGPDDLLLVVSGFGMQPVGPGKRLLARVLGEADLSGTHEEAPDGFLLAYGAHVVKGRPPRGSLADVTPTILYYLGLPVGRDMDGFARTDLLSRRFTAGRPITFIPSHDR